ncbi:RNA polymerase II holoenzyme cyclin-like subunit [Agyrium rufum]|nr:RNA polymerase II holoenzyme cyclin-like subunit [Agyrium rufum]
MAANYWNSTQFQHWQTTKSALAATRKALEDSEATLVQSYKIPDIRLLSIFFNNQLLKLASKLKIRQQAVATAQVYIRRFYTKVEIRRTNPYLVITTAMYVACKMEECPHHIKSLASEARALWPDFMLADVFRIGECEFFLISEMNCQMIVHHPYRTLNELQKELSLTSEEFSSSWLIVNDQYMADIPLLFAPHLIAITAVFLAIVLRPAQPHGLHGTAAGNLSAVNLMRTGHTAIIENAFQGTPQEKIQHLIKWLADSEIELRAVIDCTQEMISLYEIWESYSEKTCKEQLTRFVRMR